MEYGVDGNDVRHQQDFLIQSMADDFTRQGAEMRELQEENRRLREGDQPDMAAEMAFLKEEIRQLREEKTKTDVDNHSQLVTDLRLDLKAAREQIAELTKQLAEQTRQQGLSNIKNEKLIDLLTKRQNKIDKIDKIDELLAKGKPGQNEPKTESKTSQKPTGIPVAQKETGDPVAKRGKDPRKVQPKVREEKKAREEKKIVAKEEFPTLLSTTKKRKAPAEEQVEQEPPKKPTKEPEICPITGMELDDGGEHEKDQEVEQEKEKDHENEENDGQVVEDVPAPTSYANATRKLPPIIIDGTHQWEEIMQSMKFLEINYVRAKTIKGGIKVFTNTLRDYDELRNLLRRNERQHHSYKLPEDKLHRIVVRGLTVQHQAKPVAEDLIAQGIHVTAVNQMKSRRGRQLLNLFLVQTSDLKIYDIKKIRGLEVQMEPQKKTKLPTQCHKCQRYGHGQSCCDYAPRCVKCSKTHQPGSCALAEWVPGQERNATCANCQGKHPANYAGCSEAPKPKNKTPKAVRNPILPAEKTPRQGPTQTPNRQTNTTQPKQQNRQQRPTPKPKQTDKTLTPQNPVSSREQEPSNMGRLFTAEQLAQLGQLIAYQLDLQTRQRQQQC